MDAQFAEFMHRIRTGDDHAATELVRRYECLIRMEVRSRQQDPRLKNLFDSADICQSVMGSFFARAAAGHFDLERPADLTRLLVAMARHKLARKIRRQRCQCRDYQRSVPLDREHEESLAQGADPERQAAARDLLAQVRQRLTKQERLLADRRGEGWTWPEIAAAVGGTPQALRRRLTRALDRVTRLLGLDESPSCPRPPRPIPTPSPRPAADA
jgi:RNA polymerase sigma factor (sigma-70 family)